MPWAAIAAIATLAASGVGIGETLANQPSTPKPTPPAPPTPAQIGQTQNQEKSLINQNAPNVLSETSGLANRDYVAQISQLLSGTGGQTGSSGAAQQVIAQLFGLPSSPGAPGAASFKPAGTGTPNPAGANSPVNLSDFVNQFIYT